MIAFIASYFNDLVVPYHPKRAFCCQTAGLLLVPRVFKSRTGGRGFRFKVSLLWNQVPVFGSHTPTLVLRLGLKVFVVIKHIVRSDSGDPESSLCYVVIGLGCWGIPNMHCVFIYHSGFSHQFYMIYNHLHIPTYKYLFLKCCKT